MKSEGNTGTYVGGTQGLPVPRFGEQRRPPTAPPRPRSTGLDWGALRPPADNTRLGRDLADLEASDPDVAAAAKKVDEVLDRLAHPDDYAHPPTQEAPCPAPRRRPTRRTTRKSDAIKAVLEATSPEPAESADAPTTEPASDLEAAPVTGSAPTSATPAPETTEPSLSERVAKRLEDNAEKLGHVIRKRTMQHAAAKVCPRCAAQLGTIALTDLAYTFEVCGCRDGVAHDHLIEQLWHRPCLAARIIHAALQAPAPRSTAPAPDAAPRESPQPTARRSPTTRRSPNIDVADVVRRYQAGDTAPTIGAALGLSPKRVREVLDDAGVQRRDDRTAHSGGHKKSPADDNPDLVATVRRLYLEEEMPLDEVGERVGLSQKGVQGIAERHGIPLRPAAAFGHRNKASKISAADRDAIVDRYQRGESTGALAKAYGVSIPTICYHLDRAGVVRRGRGDRTPRAAAEDARSGE